jgi:hypothetical protein
MVRLDLMFSATYDSRSRSAVYSTLFYNKHGRYSVRSFFKMTGDFQIDYPKESLSLHHSFCP